MSLHTLVCISVHVPNKLPINERADYSRGRIGHTHTHTGMAGEEQQKLKWLSHVHNDGTVVKSDRFTAGIWGNRASNKVQSVDKLSNVQTY